jgi:hypothetical protein
MSFNNKSQNKLQLEEEVKERHPNRFEDELKDFYYNNK